MPKKSNNDIVQDLRDIESRLQGLIIDLEDKEVDESDTNGRDPKEKVLTSLKIGDRVLIKKPKKGQETLGTIVSIGKKFATVNTATQTIRRIPQNLKKVGK